MIKFMDKPYTQEEVRHILNPIVDKWFFSRFNSFSLPQLYGVMEIHSRNNILVSAPTGATKTLTGFLSILNELVDSSVKGILENRIYCVYVSPLKALSNDIFKNLMEPLKEMETIAGKELGIRVAVRTGDTETKERSAMLKNPPHILITTPESLAILLSSSKFIEHLKSVEWFIMDECLPYNTLITLSNGNKIEIGKLVEENLRNGKLTSEPKSEIYLKSFDMNTKKIVDKKVTKVHKIPNIRKMIRIYTKLSFSALEMTQDHPVAILGKDNKVRWVVAEKLKSGDRLLIDVNKVGDNKYSNEKGGIILTEEEFRKSYLGYFKIRNKYGLNKLKKLEKSIRRLNEFGLLPLTYSSQKINIISRLMGHLFGDGWLTITDKTVNIGFSGSIEDLNEIEKDVEQLGFKIHGKLTRKTSSTVTTAKRDILIKGQSNQFLTCSRPLAILFAVLGVPIGDKTSIDYKIPSWIISSPQSIKKEFLSSFMGSEGMKPIPSKSKNYFYAPRLSFSKKNTLIESAIFYSNQLKDMVKDFGIDISTIKIEKGNIRKDGAITKKIVITIKNNEENLLKLYGDVGYKYCKRKEELAKKACIYINCKLLARKNKKGLIECVNTFKKQGVPYKEIAEITGLTNYKGKSYGEKSWRVVDWITRKRNDKSQLKDFPSFDEFSENLLFNDLFIDEICKVSSERSIPKFVYDLTIEDTHNFFANNIIVHNCHALAENKRGVHLSLSMERLGALSPHMTRIGLSATISPLKDVAEFLVGYSDGKPRPCKMVDVQFIKEMDLKVLSPVEDLIGIEHALMHQSMYVLMDKLIQEHKTTLIFTNTRSATERVVHHLKEKFPKNYAENIGAHHGSLSKGSRLDIENRLREGKLKVVVCSTSLELGIDIGYIDLVICLGSPKSVARALQRIGRSGHRLHEKTKGRIIVLDRDDLAECAVLLKDAIERKIDKIHIPTNCLDVLAQQIDGIAIQDKIHIDELFKLVKQSYCYRNLSRQDFMEVIEYLAGKYISLEDRNVYAKIWYDEETGMVGRRGKLGRVIYMTNIGTIPEEVRVAVKVGEQTVGYIEEAFLERMRPGDIFTLGGNVYEFKFSRGMVAQVRASANRPPTIPSWFSEMLPLSYDLALDIGRFRKLLGEKFCSNKSKEEILKFINEYLYVDKNAADSLYNYFYEQHNYATIPSDTRIVVERYTDERGMKYVIFHSLYGRRVNDCLSRAVAFAIGRTQHKDVEIGINDNGFYVYTTGKIDVMKAFKLLKSEDLKKIMEMAIDKTEVLKRRFRHCAARALMILRSYKGHTKRVGRQQVSSMILLNAVRRISQHFSILKEARREVLEDLMDIENTAKVLKGIEEKKTKVDEINVSLPSPFALNLVTQGRTDVMKIEDRMEFLRRMHNNILAKISVKK